MREYLTEVVNGRRYHGFKRAVLPTNYDDDDDDDEIEVEEEHPLIRQM